MDPLGDEVHMRDMDQEAEDRRQAALGLSNCQTCVLHAEDGVPCPHDWEEYYRQQTPGAVSVGQHQLDEFRGPTAVIFVASNPLTQQQEVIDEVRVHPGMHEEIAKKLKEFQHARRYVSVWKDYHLAQMAEEALGISRNLMGLADVIPTFFDDGVLSLVAEVLEFRRVANKGRRLNVQQNLSTMADEDAASCYNCGFPKIYHEMESFKCELFEERDP